MKEWFEEWFDSPYYHLLYANRSIEEAEKFITRIVDKLNIPPGAKVLDIACGKGRHSRTLAKLGFNVTGIDLSHNSISYARQFESDNLHFQEWDMRCTYRHNGFDYAFNLFSSFGYFKDDADDFAVIKACAEDLKPGGTLVIDYMNTQCTIKNMHKRDIIQRDNIQFHIQKKVADGFIKKKIEFIADGEHHSYEEQLKIINLYRFETMLKDAGFELTQLFGDYELNRFDSGSSQRLILIAVKATANK